MEYGYAYDKKLKLMNAFGLRGFPSAGDADAVEQMVRALRHEDAAPGGGSG